jgi:hypothetical protein
VALAVSVEFIDALGGPELSLWRREGAAAAYGEGYLGLSGTTTVFFDDETDGFVGIEVADLSLLSEELPILKGLELPPVDCGELDMYGAHPADVLARAYETYLKRPVTT